MNPEGLLARDTFFVKERVGALKLTDSYDIHDVESNFRIGMAREVPPGWAKWMRLIVKKQMLPTAVVVTDGGENGAPVLHMHRGPTFWRAKVFVRDANGMSVGHFRAKILTFGGGFWVHDAQGNQVAEVKGDWKGWNFKFLDASGRELGLVTKKWAGIGKELFTSADNYIVVLHPEAASLPNGRLLLLAAALAIDIVFKEKQ